MSESATIGGSRIGRTVGSFTTRKIWGSSEVTVQG